MTPTGIAVRLVPKHDRRGMLMQEIVDHWTENPVARATVLEIASHWRLDRSTCEHLLAELAARRVIVSHEDGSYQLAR
jgi:DNA-binding IclR family transcriptional regulator